eukprot:UN02609
MLGDTKHKTASTPALDVIDINPINTSPFLGIEDKPCL